MDTADEFGIIGSVTDQPMTTLTILIFLTAGFAILLLYGIQKNVEDAVGFGLLGLLVTGFFGWGFVGFLTTDHTVVTPVKAIILTDDDAVHFSVNGNVVNR